MSFELALTLRTGGQGNGTATLNGTGTVWPSINCVLRTDISFVTNGEISGTGSVKGCGTLVSGPLTRI
jgi:hypothetical protein